MASATPVATVPEEFLRTAAEAIRRALGAEGVAVVRAEAGRWSIVASHGQDRERDWFAPAAEALDRETVWTAGGWLAFPVEAPPGTSQALVLSFRDAAAAGAARGTVEAWLDWLREGLAAVEARGAEQRRAERLEQLLRITRRWGRDQELEPLLVEMAEAATELLDADRASIFLWDRAAGELVGRPALGVEGGQLRVRDDAGVVGEVLRTGRARRVDETTEPQAIDRSVDARLGYRTRTLLCVPMRDRSGELIGVFEAINKRGGPFTEDDAAALAELAAHAAVALESAQDRQRLIHASRRMADQAAQRVELIGQTAAMAALRATIARLAETDLAVLIVGENGTGKEVVAQAIHYLSPRRERPFVAVNCAAIPESLAESELFGHERGAFTDAREPRQGKFEAAHGGTLFLDEIGDLSLASQAKLLRALEERVVVRLGGSTPIRTDVRLLAATNQDLAEMVRQKRFREDLYYRINVVTVEIPPLRRRADDVPLLADHFLEQFCRNARRHVPEFSPEARRRLVEHPWPGNVRELRNLMERIAYLVPDERIEAEQLGLILAPGRASTGAAGYEGTLADATRRFQADYIERAIVDASGSMSRAAERLGLHRSNLYRKMRQLGMAAPAE